MQKRARVRPGHRAVDQAGGTRMLLFHSLRKGAPAPGSRTLGFKLRVCTEVSRRVHRQKRGFTRLSGPLRVPGGAVLLDPSRMPGGSRLDLPAPAPDAAARRQPEHCAAGKLIVKPAGKPGSVTGIAPYDGHSSRPWVAPGLQPPTRGLERATHGAPGLHVPHPPIWCCSGWRLPRFTPWAPDARTNPRAGPKDSSLWPYSSSSPKASLRLVRTAVSRHPALWSPDFPLRALRHAATVWPASHGHFSTWAPRDCADSPTPRRGGICQILVKSSQKWRRFR